jgi:hypothetical protein
VSSAISFFELLHRAALLQKVVDQPACIKL